ncbi:MAG TPA: biosynthetic arginine decarboxylase [Gammaproteobacteria bacterium]|nr:biosynthetic arginine decarboxylase [Gammaproteobacteria bacterium]
MNNIQKARDIYNLAHWGDGYFDIADNGHLNTFPARDGHGIDLHALTGEIRQVGLALPVLVRFSGILHDRVARLCGAFTKAMQTHGYGGGYTAVYPIKVNQQQSVVRELLDAADEKRIRVGLEAGSKPELMAVLALSTSNGGRIICNGYKDREYIRLALIGQRLGHHIILVLEQPSELALIIRESRALGVTPRLGVRVRLASIGRGNWQNSGGEKAKFGLSAQQLLAAVAQLREAGLLDALELLHCHMGSQLANIRDIQRGLRECARYYAELHRQGVGIHCVDVGGGLGVDYEGTRSRSDCSMNYSLQEYANNVVHTLREVCRAEGLPQPHIITESGRALTAHHAMLITEVTDVEQAVSGTPIAPPADGEAQILRDLWQGLQELSTPGANPRAVVEIYHDAVHWLAEAQTLYVHGVLDMAAKARAEEIYFATCAQLRQRLNPGIRAQHEILGELNEKLADKYFCNFSLFQSMPDVWAIEQVFPIVPLHRHEETPDRRGTLQDITCDSDGRIDRYVDGEGLQSSLPLHAPRDGEPYWLGIFLLGAYQEILGDMHNLFGGTNAVDVRLDADGRHHLTHIQHGDTVAAVLRHVHFEPAWLLDSYRTQLAATTLPAQTQAAYLAELEAGLSGYTYLED